MPEAIDQIMQPEQGKETLKAGNSGGSFFKWCHKCFTLTARKKRAPEPHYQTVIKITGYLLSLYLNSRHSNWVVIASKKKKQKTKKVISPMQLINTEGMQCILGSFPSFMQQLPKHSFTPN